MTQVPKYLQLGMAVKLDDPKLMPYRAHPTDAGADLFTKESIEIAPGTMAMVDTGVAMRIPLGHVGLVFNRSSQGKVLVRIANGTGVIDSDYRGNIKVLLQNDGDKPYNIIKYETRVAQIVIVPVFLPEFKTWKGTDYDWQDTQRGTGGFGSTGT